jgi:hypothetical protein
LSSGRIRGAIGQADSGAVDLDDIACVAAMIRDAAHDILEALDNFAAPADM